MQGLQDLLRQGTDAKDHDPPRQAAGTVCVQRLDEIPMDTGAGGLVERRADVFVQGPPESRLPLLPLGDGEDLTIGLAQLILAVEPVAQPVCPVNLVLVIDIRQVTGELVTLPERITLFQKARQGLIDLSLRLQQPWHKPEQPPLQPRLLEG